MAEEIARLSSWESAAQRTEEVLDRIIRPYADEVCRRYGIDVKLGASVRLTPERDVTRNYVDRIAAESAAPQSNSFGSLLREISPDGRSIAAVGEGSWIVAKAVRQRGLRAPSNMLGTRAASRR